MEPTSTNLGSIARATHDFWTYFAASSSTQPKSHSRATDKPIEVFPEDQIQLIGIEAREFDDLADLETERPFYRTQSLTRLARWGFEDLARSLSS